MKLPLDRSVLVDMGLGALSDADLDSLLVALIGSLELSVGNTLAARLTDAEMVELDSLKGAAAAAWLDAHAPGYREGGRLPVPRTPDSPADAGPPDSGRVPGPTR